MEEDNKKDFNEKEIKLIYYNFMVQYMPSVKKIFDRQRYITSFCVGTSSVILSGFIYAAFPNLLLTAFLSSSTALLFYCAVEETMDLIRKKIGNKMYSDSVDNYNNIIDNDDVDIDNDQ